MLVTNTQFLQKHQLLSLLFGFITYQHTCIISNYVSRPRHCYKNTSLFPSSSVLGRIGTPVLVRNISKDLAIPTETLVFFFLVGFRIYQHPYNSSKYQSRHAIPIENLACFLPSRLQDLSALLYQLETLVTDTPFLQKHKLVFCMVGLRNQQHPCISSNYQSRPCRSYRNHSLFPYWSALELISTPVLGRNISHDHAIPTETLAFFFLVRLKTYQHPCISSNYQSRPRDSYRNTSLFPSRSALEFISTPELAPIICHDHAILQKHQFLSFLFDIMTYRHPCISWKYQSRPRNFYRNTNLFLSCWALGLISTPQCQSLTRHSYRNCSLFPCWMGLGFISTPVLVRNISHDHSIPTEKLACFLPGWAQDLSAPLYLLEFFVTTTPFVVKHQLFSFLVGLRIYQHPSISSNSQSRPRHSYKNTSFFPSFSSLGFISTPVLARIISHVHAIPQKHQIFRFLIGQRIYQHPCVRSNYQSRPRHSYRNTSFFPSWSAKGLIGTPVLARLISYDLAIPTEILACFLPGRPSYLSAPLYFLNNNHDHAIPTETPTCFLPGRPKDLSAPLYQLEILVTTTPFLQKHQPVSFLVGLSIYQHPFFSSKYQSPKSHSYRITCLFPSWSALGIISTPVLA